MANLTAHEMLELHKILSNQSLCIKKIESNAGMVRDQEFASFIQNSLANRRRKLEEMQQFINKSFDLH